jgi:Cdc6-like AAA superfamily ATPase
MNEPEKIAERNARLSALNTAFSPSAPILLRDYFTGRNLEINEVVESINERGQHVLVYGERGVGKTSFANVIGSELINLFPVKITCNRSDSFKSLWEKAFAKVQFEEKKKGIGYLPVENNEVRQLDLFLPKSKSISSLDIQCILEKVDANLLFIFDEYDSITDEQVKSGMADTIKALSDNAPRVTVMLVGIAKNVVDLIGEHPSLERCLRQVRLREMSDPELHTIIERGLAQASLTMDALTKSEIVSLSQGYPHFTHLLAKQACKAAIEDDKLNVLPSHFYVGLSASAKKADESIRSIYQRATFSTNDKSNFEAVLWSCALAKPDVHGTFRTKDVVDSFTVITKRQTAPEALNYNLGKLCLAERGAIIERLREGKYVRYRFRNPLIRIYIKLRYETISKRAQILKSTRN